MQIVRIRQALPSSSLRATCAGSATSSSSSPKKRGICQNRSRTSLSLTHLLGAAKRQIAHLSELKRFHESNVFDLALRTDSHLSFVIECAILDGDPHPQYLGQDET